MVGSWKLSERRVSGREQWSTESEGAERSSEKRISQWAWQWGGHWWSWEEPRASPLVSISWDRDTYFNSRKETVAWTGRGRWVLTSRAPLAQVNLLSGVDDHLWVKVRSASPSFTIEEPAPPSWSLWFPSLVGLREHAFQGAPGTWVTGVSSWEGTWGALILIPHSQKWKPTQGGPGLIRNRASGAETHFCKGL